MRLKFLCVPPYKTQSVSGRDEDAAVRLTVVTVCTHEENINRNPLQDTPVLLMAL